VETFQKRLKTKKNTISEKPDIGSDVGLILWPLGFKGDLYSSYVSRVFSRFCKAQTWQLSRKQICLIAL
jgi:hypothetical protein